MPRLALEDNGSWDAANPGRISLSSNASQRESASTDRDLARHAARYRGRPSLDEQDSTYGSYSTPIHTAQEVNKTPRAASSGSSKSSSTHRDEAEDIPSKENPVSWRSLPRKDQLLVLLLARLAEPLTQTSLSSYMFFMLKSFGPSQSDSQTSEEAGILTGSFTAAQCVTAVLWGRLADKEWMGRKNVLIIGLLGTFVSAIGFGFSNSFWMTLCFRSLGGALNGNVGVMRTMISEIILEKKFQPKAFLIMPVTFNVGVLVGPLLGGWLQDPVNTFPRVFGPGSRLGGTEGVRWMKAFPYALPNIVTGAFLFLSVFLVIFFLEETHVERRHLPDYGIQFRQTALRLLRTIFSRGRSHEYSKLASDAPDAVEMGLSADFRNKQDEPVPKRRPKLPYSRIFTRNVRYTLLTHGLLAGHLGAFSTMWFLFLSTPRWNPSHPRPSKHTSQHFPFSFAGGLGLAPKTIGVAIGILGALGLTLQFGVYSRITHRFGILKTYRHALLLFPVTYCLAPYLAVLPTRSPPPHAADGPWVWLGVSALLLIQVTGRTFALPITQILVNNCTPHPSVLSSVHGLGQSVSAGSRTVGPVVWSALYGAGLRVGVVGMAWWVLAGEAVLVVLASLLVYEGSGCEVVLEEEEEEEGGGR